MGVKLARPLFMGIQLQLAHSKWVLYLIKKTRPTYNFNILSLINVKVPAAFYTNCKELNKSVSKYAKPSFQQQITRYVIHQTLESKLLY